MSALSDQTEPVGIFRELSRAIWAKWRDGDECPQLRILTPEFVAAWIEKNPPPIVDDAVIELLRYVHDLDDNVPVLTEWHTARPLNKPDAAPSVYVRWMHSVDDEGSRILTEAATGTGDALLLAFERKVELRGEVLCMKTLHRYSETARQAGKNLRHPCSNLAAACLQSPPYVGNDERRHQNIHGVLVGIQHASLHRNNDQLRLPFDDANLTKPLPPPNAARFETAYLLPEWEPESSMLPRALLDLLDFGASRGSGGPVPVPQRVGLELLLMPAPGDWQAEQATLTLTLGDLGYRVWPTIGYRSGEHGSQLYQAARWLNDPDNATWFRRNQRSLPILIVTFFAPPVAPYRRDQTIGVHVVLPDGGRKRGAQFDANLRRVLAATSYCQHRVYLAAVSLWDRHATFRGYMVQLTQPVVERNPADYVLDSDGEIVSEKNKRPSKRATHPLAVHTGEREPNPAAAVAYPFLEGHDVILVAHHRVADTIKLRNMQRGNSIETLRALRNPGTRRKGGKVIVTRDAVLDFEVRYRSDGVLTGADLDDLVKHKKRTPPHAKIEAVRLLPPAAHFAAYEARQKATRKRRQRRS